MNWLCLECGTENNDSLDTIQNEYVACSHCGEMFEIELDEDGEIDSINGF